jgi:hypothetical protein
MDAGREVSSACGVDNIDDTVTLPFAHANVDNVLEGWSKLQPDASELIVKHLWPRGTRTRLFGCQKSVADIRCV